MNKLIESIERGKVRGIEEYKLIDGERYCYQYALKKIANKYVTYLFFIPESKMDVMEDYGSEEIKEFFSITDAINYFTSIGVDFSLFIPIKGVLPF
ncbi:hypothetical protein KN848_001165 [Salmonella enterica]|nr:hypothetical protein [Salmonella enterica]